MKVTVSIAFCLATIVIVLGAYTRLVDAGLGCPDWPGCYGLLTVPLSAEQVQAAEETYPETPVEADKAWTEMVHRYAAFVLWLLVVSMPIVAWRTKRHLTLPLVLAVLVTVQGAFGAWTVTLKLWPQVVTAHLLGGIATLALLWWYRLQLSDIKIQEVPRAVRTVTWVCLGLVVWQIGLGGWVSSNYAALACPDFPTCHGQWWPDTDFTEGFNVFQDIGPNYLGGEMSSDARVAIQLTHRLFGVATLLLFLFLSWKLRGALGLAVGGLVVAQFVLGISNVWFGLPLPIAVMHNAGAAALVIAIVTAIAHTRTESLAREP